MPQRKTNTLKLPTPPHPVKSALVPASASPPAPPAAPGDSAGRCAHEAIQCCACGALLISAEVCPDPAAHAPRRPEIELAPAAQLHDSSARACREPGASYNSDWPRDEEGYAKVIFSNSHSGRSVTLPCFAPFRDPETGILLPLCPRAPKLPGSDIEIISGLTRHQFNERSASLPGRDSIEHGRWFLATVFFRDYYFVSLHKQGQRQTRSSRKWSIRKQHREANCTDPCCRRRHR